MSGLEKLELCAAWSAGAALGYAVMGEIFMAITSLGTAGLCRYLVIEHIKRCPYHQTGGTTR